jgi:hypothetical protein
MRGLVTTLVFWLLAAAPASASIPTRGAVCPSDIPRSGYSDVYPLSVHAFDIDCIAWRSITDPRSTFRPNEALTRWEMATWLDATLLWVQDRYTSTPVTFVDTAALEAFESIEALRRFDVTRGVGGDEFDPFGAVPRWQMALFLTRTYAAAGNQLPPASDWGFADISGETREARTAINQLAALGVTNGTGPTTFAPDDPVTREQMASFVARLLEQIWVLHPTATTCVTTALPIRCSGAMVAVSQPSALRVRIPMFMADHIGGLDYAQAVISDPGTRIDIYLDGAQIPVSSTLRRSSGVVYRYWEGQIPTGLRGSISIESRSFIRGVLTTVRQVSVDFR